MTSDKTVTFRLPADLLKKLRQSAKKTKRSLSADIISRLLSTLED